MPGVGHILPESAAPLEAMCLASALSADIPRALIGTAVLGSTHRHLVVLGPIGTRIASVRPRGGGHPWALDTPRSNFNGRFCQLTDAVCEPKPVQSRLPIPVGASDPKTLRVVAK